MSGSHPAAGPPRCPVPGVYARHNAVDIPALLPDGSYAERVGGPPIAHAPHGSTAGRNTPAPEGNGR